MTWWGRFAKPPIFSPPTGPCPNSNRGDLVAILSAGAYGAVMASAYNARPPAPEVLVTGEEWGIVRSRQTHDDLIAQDRIPAWLATDRRRAAARLIALARAVPGASKVFCPRCGRRWVSPASISPLALFGPVRLHSLDRCRRWLLAATITATALSLVRRLCRFRLAALERRGAAAGARQRSQAPAHLRRPTTVLVGDDPFSRWRCGRCTRRGPCPAASACAPPRIRPGRARQPGPALVSADRCWRQAWCWRAATWRARLIRRLRQWRGRRRHHRRLGRSAALYRHAADHPAAW